MEYILLTKDFRAANKPYDQRIGAQNRSSDPPELVKNKIRVNLSTDIIRYHSYHCPGSFVESTRQRTSDKTRSNPQIPLKQSWGCGWCSCLLLSHFNLVSASYFVSISYTHEFLDAGHTRWHSLD